MPHRDTRLAIKIELLIHALNATQGHMPGYQNRATNTLSKCHSGTHVSYQNRATNTRSKCHTGTQA